MVASVKPNFFVVGAAKSGTTSLYFYLKQHPDIFLPPVKEPVFFAIDIVEWAYKCRKHIAKFNQERYFSQKKLSYKHILFIKEFDYYKRLYLNTPPGKIAGDMCTFNLFSKIAAKKIKEFNPEAKIIIILRNPVERAYSHFLMMLRDGKTKGRNFLQEVIDDFEKDDKKCKEFYIEQGFYFSQVKRYIDVFGKERVKIFLFEDFTKNTEEVLKTVFDFLELPFFEVDLSVVFNKSSMPKFPALNAVVKSVKRNISFLSNLETPVFIKRFYNSFFMERSRESVSLEERKVLLRIFRKDIIKTAKLIKRDLSRWLMTNEWDQKIEEDT